MCAIPLAKYFFLLAYGIIIPYTNAPYRHACHHLKLQGHKLNHHLGVGQLSFLTVHPINGTQPILVVGFVVAIITNSLFD